MTAVKRDQLLAVLEHKLNAQRPGFDKALASAIAAVHRELGLEPICDVDLRKIELPTLRFLFASLILETTLWPALLASKPGGAFARSCDSLTQQT